MKSILTPLLAALLISSILPTFAANVVAVLSYYHEPWENKPFAKFEVFRTVNSDTSTTCSVDYFTSDGTARAGLHYVQTSGTVVFGPGERIKDLTIPLTADNGVLGGDVIFHIHLTNAVDATIETGEGARFQSEVLIRDNELPAGNPDLTFRPSVNGHVHAAAVQQDGKILIGGSFSAVSGVERPGLARLNPDGSLDASYLPRLEGDGTYGPAVVNIYLAGDGSALVMGEFSKVSGFSRPGIVRLLPDGSADESFAPPSDIRVWVFRLLALLKDRRLFFENTSDRSVRMLLANGKEDTTFKFADILNVETRRVAEDKEGRLLVSLFDGNTYKFVRLKGDGSLDSSFKFQLDFPKTPADVDVENIVVQPDERILVSGYYYAEDSTTGRFFSRLNPDGSRDPSFLPATETSGELGGLALQNDGRILVQTRSGTHWIRRLNADGTLDPSFTPVIVKGFVGGKGPLLSFSFTVHENMLIVSSSGWVESGSLNGVMNYGIARLRLDQGPSSAVAVWQETMFEQETVVAEDIGEARFIVRRFGESLGTARVSYATRDGTAKAGRDYVAKVGIVEFGPLEVEKTVSIPVLDNEVLDPTRTFEVVFSNAVGLESVGAPASITIRDDEVGFLPNAIRLFQNASTGQQYAVVRWNSTATADYRLESSIDLKSWSQVNGTPSNDGFWWQHVDTDVGASTHRFYRLREIRP